MANNVTLNPGVGGAAVETTEVSPGVHRQKVDVASLPAIPAGTNNIGDVDVLTLPITQPLTDTQLRASAVPVSGPLTDTQLRAAAVPVSGTFWQATQPVSMATNTPDVTDRAARLVGSASLGVSSGKTVVMKTGTLITTLATADQVILTYTVTAGKTFYLEYVDFSGRLTAVSGTATLLGTMSLESPSGTKLITVDGVTNPALFEPDFFFGEPIPIAASTVIRVVCTPAAITSMTWRASFGGYEK